MFYTGSAVNAHTPVNSISNLQIKINRLSSVFFMNFDTQRHRIFYIFDKSHQKGLFFDYIGNGKQIFHAGAGGFGRRQGPVDGRSRLDVARERSSA